MSAVIGLERRLYRILTRGAGSLPSFGYRPGILFGLPRRCSVLRSVLASLRFRGVVVVGRGARISVSRRASLVMAPGTVLTVGTEPMPDRPTLVRVEPRGRLSVSGIVTLMSGCHVHVHYDAAVEIGTGTFLNAGTTLTCHERVVIGRGCAVSWGVTITDTDIHTIVRSGARRPNRAPVVIDDHVWIGTGAIVLKGCSLGESSVIAAGAVVTSAVPAGGLVRGNPAQIVGSDVGWQI